MTLDELVRSSALRSPQQIAFRHGDDALTYDELDTQADKIGAALRTLGVQAGDRVGIYLEKGVGAVVAMQGILRIGAVYVPVDPMSPAARARLIMQDCAMRAVICDPVRASQALVEDLAALPCIISGAPPDARPSFLAWDAALAAPLAAVAPHGCSKNELAYILYTSGSTGTPKGVCISHENALAFVRWAAEELHVEAHDVLANHAPFHFDLSVLDLYVAFLLGATVHIIPESIAYVPAALVDFIKEARPTIWYSVPSVLTMMVGAGLGDLASLPMRAVCFAGEPWPVEQLKAFRARFRDVRLLNLYGPTETNVCTFYEVGGDVSGFERPVPIGRLCCGDRGTVVKDDGTVAGVGEKGELIIDGPTVMLGYWGKPPQAGRPYPTGDIVQILEDGQLSYVGRRDHMVKIHGFRIELGEVEAALAQHPGLADVAVVVSTGADPQLVAFAVARSTERPRLLELKQHCAKRLPRYMIIDKVRYLEIMPRTRNGKINRLELASALANEKGDR